MLAAAKLLVFGAEGKRGNLHVGPGTGALKAGDGITEVDLVHRPERSMMGGQAHTLSRMQYSQVRVPLGVFWNLEKPSCTDMLAEPKQDAIAGRGPASWPPSTAAMQPGEVT